MKSEISVVIEKSKFQLSIYEADMLIQTFTIGVGENPGDKESAGDKRTPEGNFHICSIEDSSAWKHDFYDGKGVIANAYGPWFIRLCTTSKDTKSGKTWIGIGIHGTHDPSRLGTRCTEGCIRMNNSDLLKLLKMVEVGTKVEILD
jgi:lipoprotein-anchoring transpeptidase ErfK/SrfK